MRLPRFILILFLMSKRGKAAAVAVWRGREACCNKKVSQEYTNKSLGTPKMFGEFLIVSYVILNFS